MKARPVAIFYENSAWFSSLFEELEKRRIPFVRINAEHHTYNPAERDVPFSILVNRVGASAYSRGNVQSLFQSNRYLAHVERLGVPVLNGSFAQEIEGSKAKQLDLLASLGLPFPKTRVVNHVSQILPAAKSLRFPVVLKISQPENGSSIRKYNTVEQLEAAIDSNSINIGGDYSAIIQEFITSRDNHIVRVETLNGKFLYAVKVFTKTETFNLRPYQDTREGEAEEASQAFRVEAFTPSDWIIRDIERIAKAAHLDSGAIEYVTDAKTDLVYYSNIVALSNFVKQPVPVLGFDPVVKFVDYIEQRLWPIYEREPVLAI